MSTFGNSPAALYLERTLNSYGNDYVSRKVGARIHATNAQVSELWRSFLSGKLSAKTVNHVLGLMRNEIRDSVSLFQSGHIQVDVKSIESLIDKLTRNVQIGTIKHTLNEVAFRGKWLKTKIKDYHRHWAKTGEGFSERNMNQFRSKLEWTCEYDAVKTGTELLLMLRSDKRCIRQGKPHTKEM